MTDIKRLLEWHESEADTILRHATDVIGEIGQELASRHAETARILAALEAVREGCRVRYAPEATDAAGIALPAELEITGPAAPPARPSRPAGEAGMSEPKPCLWCKTGKGEVLDHTDFFGGWFTVGCGECGAKGPSKETRAEAVTAWNTRATDAELDRLREDAERYQWLRRQIQHGPLVIAAVREFDGLQSWSGDDPDSAIDEARKG